MDIILLLVGCNNYTGPHSEMSAENFTTCQTAKNPTTFLFLSEQYQICKRKLDSKCEALLILTKDLDQCRQERDQFKLMAEQVQERYQALKRQLAGVVSTVELCVNARRKGPFTHAICVSVSITVTVKFTLTDNGFQTYSVIWSVTMGTMLNFDSDGDGQRY